MPVSLDVSTLSGHDPDGVLLVHLLREAETTASPGLTAKPAPAGSADRDRPGLTRRELEILGLIREGRSTRLLAERLRLSPATVRNHTQSILRKLGAHSRLEAVAFAMRQRLLP